MTSNQTPNLNKYNFLGFSFVLLFLLSFVFYQVFTDSSHKRISIKKFLSVSTLKKALEKMSYQPFNIGNPQNFPTPNPLSFDCRSGCYFSYQGKEISTLIDDSTWSPLDNLTLNFFDLEAGLIGHQNINQANPTFYVLSTSGQLIQAIRLSLNQNKLLSFIDYYPKTKQILFKSIDQVSQKQEFMLYSATSPSLTLSGVNQP